jgi:pimeloyl-ACP methyl ester carboxylesterase
MSSMQPPPPAGAVRSKDGTTIGYRQAGDGPGVVVVHGSAQSSQNLMALATALSDRFSVYVPDRRGRGTSGPYGKEHGVGTEIDDLGALLDQTRAHNVFGLSAGAVIAIEAARTLPAITRLALYEPPLEFDGITQTSWLPRYEREMAAGRLAAALVTIMKGTADRTAFRVVPRFPLTGALSLAIRMTDGRPVPAGVVSPRDLIPTVHYDARTVLDAAGPLDRFAGLSCEVLKPSRRQKDCAEATTSLNPHNGLNESPDHVAGRMLPCGVPRRGTGFGRVSRTVLPGDRRGLPVPGQGCRR